MVDFFEMEELKDLELIEEEKTKVKTLDELKSEAFTKLVKMKAKEKYGVIEYNNLHYYATREALTNYKDTVDLMSRKSLDKIVIKVLEGKIEVSKADLDTVVTLIGEKLYNIWNKYDELKTKVENVKTKKALKEIMDSLE